MDRSLARGYANRYLDRLLPHGEITRWQPGVKVPCIGRVLGNLSRADGPDAMLKRLAPLLTPVFPAPEVMSWNVREGRAIRTRRITNAPSSAVLHPDDPGLPLFDEQAAFLTRIFFVRRPRGDVLASALVSGGIETTAGIGAHAIRRLLERDLATQETLPHKVSEILVQAGAFHEALDGTDLDDERPWPILLPIKGGAVVAVTHKVKPWPGLPEHSVGRMASIRTVLSERQLTPDEQDRLSGCDDPVDLKLRDSEAFGAWLKRNARPWDVHTLREAAPPEPAEVVAEDVDNELSPA